MGQFQLANYSTNLFYYFALLPGIVFALLLYAGYAANHIQINVSDDALELDGVLYGRTVSKSSLVLDGIRKVDVAADRELTPVKRTNGFGTSSIKYGWFTLQNGEKALLALSDQKNAVYIPTTEGFAFLVSPDDPDELVSKLRK